jgi:hypothetical protein
MSERNGTLSLTKSETDGAGPEQAEPNRAAEVAPEGAQLTAPVSVRPAPRAPRRASLTRMGPWAPVAGAIAGLLLGLVGVLAIGGAAETFAHRLALVLLVVGLGMAGAAGMLLADEVQLQRRGGRPIPGVTPGRLLLVVSGFVLFLAAFLVRG